MGKLNRSVKRQKLLVIPILPQQQQLLLLILMLSAWQNLTSSSMQLTPTKRQIAQIKKIVVILINRTFGYIVSGNLHYNKQSYYATHQPNLLQNIMNSNVDQLIYIKN